MSEQCKKYSDDVRTGKLKQLEVILAKVFIYLFILKLIFLSFPFNDPYMGKNLESLTKVYVLPSIKND